MVERAKLIPGGQVDTTGDRSADEIRRDIAVTRDSIRETVGRLNDRVEMALDWRTYVADSPFIALGAAVGLGFLLSGVFRPRPTVRERFADALVESVEEFTGHVRDRFDRLSSERVGPRRAVTAAATAIATQAVAAYVKGKLMDQPLALERSSRTQSSGSGE